MVKRRRQPLELEHHVQDEHNGGTIGWLVHLDDHRQVWCGEISKALFDRQAPEHQEAMGDDCGWFVVLFDNKAPKDQSSTILARVRDEYQGQELAIVIARGLIAEPKGIAALQEHTA